MLLEEPELKEFSTRVMPTNKVAKLVDILFDLILNDIIFRLDLKNFYFYKWQPGLIPPPKKMSAECPIEILKQVLQYKTARVWVANYDPMAGFQELSFDLVSSLKLLLKDFALPQTKKRERVVFVKARKSRAAKKSWASVRVPHK